MRSTFLGMTAVFGCNPPHNAPIETPSPSTCTTSPEQTVGSATPLDALSFEHPFGAEVPVQMATTWGDREGGAHATVGIFGPGFDSGPHTHTHAYYGVVLQGTMTNPFGTEADPVQMGPGSHWYVPAGEQHATRCVSTDEDCLFYFHADDPFDFLPADALSEPRSPEALSVPFGELVFEEVADFVSMAGAFGDRGAGAHGTFGRFPGMASAPEHIHGAQYLGIVLSGTLINPFGGDASSTELGVGGVWEVPQRAQHRTACVSSDECLFYFHSGSAFDFTPVCE